MKADICSCSSFNELARDGQDAAERWNRLNPKGERRVPYVTSLLEGRSGPGDRGDRLHPDVPGAGSGVRADAVYRDGSRRVRAVGYPGEPAAAPSR